MRPLVFIAFALLAVAPFGAAQVPAPPTPVYTVVIQNAPAEFGAFSTNATVDAPFEVVLRLANVVCANAVTIPVTLTATAGGAPGFFSVITEPSVVNITVSQGPHGSEPVGSAGGGTASSVARATIAGNITTNASVQVTLTATAAAPPGAPEGCSGAGSIGEASSAPVTVFANMTAPPPPPEPTPQEEDTPGVGLLAVLAVAAAVAIAARKRRA